MIEQQTVQGKPAIVAYFNDDFESCDPEDAAIVKVIFEDGSNIFITPDGLEELLGKEGEELPLEEE